MGESRKKGKTEEDVFDDFKKKKKKLYLSETVLGIRNGLLEILLLRMEY